VLKVDLSKIPLLGSYQIIIDSVVSERIESQLIKAMECIEIKVDEIVPSWNVSIENGSCIIYSACEEVNVEIKEIVITSIGYEFDNCIELAVNLDNIGIKDVITEYYRLDKIIRLDYQYNDKKLRIYFSKLNGFVDGDFTIYVLDEEGGRYSLCYDTQSILSFKEEDHYFFVYGTAKSARYAYFTPCRHLRYIIKPVNSYQKLQKKKD
jgi:hypothetical protein